MREEARDWYEGALVDMEEAESALRENRRNWALFAAQQALEKCFKAVIMVKRRERPPRTHDLVELVRLSTLEFEERILASIAELSPYYSVSRYPNAGLRRPWEGISERTARRLVDEARKIVERIGLEFGFAR
ncbi:MAG: HEPN domain-containing protein [Candidatus Bathyarchaeia archaeon]